MIKNQEMSEKILFWTKSDLIKNYDTIYANNAINYALEIHYILNETYYKLSITKGLQFCDTISAAQKGKYYFAS